MYLRLLRFVSEYQRWTTKSLRASSADRITGQFHRIVSPPAGASSGPPVGARFLSKIQKWGLEKLPRTFTHPEEE